MIQFVTTRVRRVHKLLLLACGSAYLARAWCDVYRTFFITVPDQCLCGAMVLYVTLLPHVVINLIYCCNYVFEHILMCVQRRSTVCINCVLLGWGRV